MALKQVTFFLEDRQIKGGKKLTGFTGMKGSNYLREGADEIRALFIAPNLDLHLCTSFLLTMNVFFNQSISWGWRSGKH